MSGPALGYAPPRFCSGRMTTRAVRATIVIVVCGTIHEMKTPTAVQLIAELRKRAEEGRFTLDRDDLIRIASMLEKLETRCAEAYQVVGSLATDAGLFGDPAVTKALDLLSAPHRDGEILPFHTAKNLKRTAGHPPRAKSGSSPKASPAKARKPSGK